MLGAKIIALQNYITSQNANALLLASLGHEINDSILTYLLGYEPEYAAVLITKDKAILWLTPFEVREAVLKFPEIMVRPLRSTLITLVIEEITTGKILTRGTVLSVNLAKALGTAGYELRQADNIEQVVVRKNSAEIVAMRTVCTKTDELFAELIAHWSEFNTEQDAAKFIYSFALANNCEVSFPPIIACGANAAEPHHQTNNTKLSPGFCVIDLGLKIKGYCSDLSRTIFLGTPSVEETELYELVKKAQTESVSLVKPGTKASDLDFSCRRNLGTWEKNFIHGLGHGVGTAVHEWPNISSLSQAVLEKGMIITIEPGIYLSGKFGIRIEDDVLVTETGFEVLNQTTKELIVIA